MGLSRLEQIARRLMAAGKLDSTPAAVLSGGNSPHPAAVRGTLADIGEKARRANVQPPAVIVVGAVAGMDLSSPMAAPLEGVTVGLSGSEPMTKKLSAALDPLGARTFIAQQSVIQELPLPIGLDSLCD